MASIFSPLYLLSQSTTASIAVVEELSSEDAAEFEERVTIRKAKRGKQLLESASKCLSSAMLRAKIDLRQPSFLLMPRTVTATVSSQGSRNTQFPRFGGRLDTQSMTSSFRSFRGRAAEHLGRRAGHAGS